MVSLGEKQLVSGDIPSKSHDCACCAHDKIDLGGVIKVYIQLKYSKILIHIYPSDDFQPWDICVSKCSRIPVVYTVYTQINLDFVSAHMKKISQLGLRAIFLISHSSANLTV